MISAAHKNLLDQLVSGVNREELLWITGYLNGLVAAQPHNEGTAKQTGKVTVIYGTETGNAKRLALQFTAAAKKRSLAVKCIAADQYHSAQWAKDEVVLVVISTQGEGEPPLAAKAWYDQLMASSESLSHLRFSVLALGDSSYPMFCKTGVDVQTKLLALGAQELTALQTCDVDVDLPAAQWTEKVLAALDGVKPASKTAIAAPGIKQGRVILEGKIKVNVNLHDKGSDQQTYHIELETAEELDYEPGDSIAIVPSNKPEVVQSILQYTKLQGSTLIKTPKWEGAVEELLTHRLNICYLLGSSVKKYAEITGHNIPDQRMDLVDLVRRYPVKDAEHFRQFVETLHAIAPRLYSIASSASVTPQEVHLTVSRRRFTKEDAQHFGLCSSFLGDLPVGTKINFYIHRNKQFRLPASDKDIIMVGPGTGIATFRAFLAERDHQSAPGRNWLFFGEKDFVRDFLYQNEVQQYVQTGVLQKVNLSFQMNHPKKAWVEDDLRAQGADVFAWLEQGAYFYVSGLKEQLTAQVDQALAEIVQIHGGKTEDEARSYIDRLKKDNRLHKDVY